MSAKIKDKKYNEKLNKQQIFKSNCEVPKTTIFFSFQYITSDNRYNINYLNNCKNGKEKDIYYKLFSTIEKLSHSSWEELSFRRKQSGGYETIPYGSMKDSISNRLPSDKKISYDTKLIVFRFGNDYRMIGYKSNRCKAAMHIIGFDFDYSLYDHGS